VVFFYDWYGSGRTSLLPVLVMVALKISCPFLQQPNADSRILLLLIFLLILQMQWLINHRWLQTSLR
jgi:hypothetical protein